MNAEPTSSESRPTSQRQPVVRSAGLWGLWVAILVWGVFLAIGATGRFSDTGMFRPVRSLIVMTCSSLFLGGWYWVAGRPLREDAPGARPWNRASLVSLVGVGLGYVSWGLAWAGWHDPASRGWTAPCGWTALVLFGIGAIGALVGLSDPRGRRGQLLGLVALVLLLVAVVLFIVQVQNYVGQQSRPVAGRLSAGVVRCRTTDRLPLSRLVST